MFNWRWRPGKVAVFVMLAVAVIGHFGIQIPLQDWAQENECWAVQLHQMAQNRSRQSIPFRDQAGFESYLDDRVSRSDVLLTEAQWRPKEVCATYVIDSDQPVAEVARQVMTALALPVSKLELGVTNNQVMISLYCSTEERKEK